MLHKAIFLDKDGTLVVDVPYNVDPRKIVYNRGALELLPALKQLGYKLIMISNQSGVARGYFSYEALQSVVDKIQTDFKPIAAPFDAFYFCPHHPCGNVDKYSITCSCRKPRPGMLLQAADDLGIDLLRSWMVGDILHDVEAGNRAGCKTILINNGNETEWEIGPFRTPTLTRVSLEEALQTILSTHYSLKNES